MVEPEVGSVEQRRTAIARQIHAARRQCRLTQEQVAQIVGCSRIKMNRVERAQADLTVVELDHLARTLDLPITYFFPD